MRKELIIKSKSLVGSTDLTVLAPIKPGLIPSLETVTYKTRVKAVLRTLNSGRTSSHEYSLFRPFSDAVERVGKIHSVRVAIVEPDQVLLSVTFDGSWDSYLRALWQKVGPLLDIIFCNTVDYVDAYGHTYEQWAAWVQRAQIETNFFYAMPALTVDDVQYLKKTELAVRRSHPDSDTDLQLTRTTTTSVEQSAWHGALSSESTLMEAGRQGVRALSVLHRLTSMHLPGTPDGDFLHRATRDLLKEFMELVEAGPLRGFFEGARRRFPEQTSWLEGAVKPRMIPPRPVEKPAYDEADVQGGVLTAYQGVTHGCLLLVAFKGSAGLARFLETMAKKVTHDGKQPTADKPAINIHFTYGGLRAVGLSEEQLALFPEDFRQGMEARASVLGDIRINHPRRWQLPKRNYLAASNAAKTEIELSAVHAVIQIRIAGSTGADEPEVFGASELQSEADKLMKEHGALLDVLHVQPLLRHLHGDGKVREHFGFVDGKSQPIINPAENENKIYNGNLAHLGEFLLGYPNDADEEPGWPKRSERFKWLRNGTFLVVRKLSQDVAALNRVVKDASGSVEPKLIKAKMMGRHLSGEPLTKNGEEPSQPSANINDFDFEDDKDGAVCPLHSHIRRSNPRRKDDPQLPSAPGGRTPRIMRRGMSYGPLFNESDPQDKNNAQPRGLVFMAYNASISEQFEVIQRWISGGNSTGGYSGQSDPFMGLDPHGKQRFFRYEHDNKVHKVALDGADTPLAEPQPFVRLEWGAYLFTPSITALRKLQYSAMRSDGTDAPVWSGESGLEAIKTLQKIEYTDGPERAADAWKAALEDTDAQETFASASIWAAIRDSHEGVLRTPYGTIAASYEHVMQVLGNDKVFSVCGYHERMQQSIGEIYLGLDDEGKGCPYRQQSEKANAAISALEKKDAFTASHDYAKKLIDGFISGPLGEKTIATEAGEKRWELNLNVKEIVDKVLERLCQHWFGLPPAKAELQPGGARWDWASGDPTDPPRYPGNFSAPSRYLFQPRPGPTVESFGRDYGQSLTIAFRQWVDTNRAADGSWKAVPSVASEPDPRIARAIFEAFPDRKHDDLVARTMVGALMGFLPTVDGNLRLSMNEWLRDGTFWSLRAALANRNLYPFEKPFENAKKLLEPALLKAMQLRPSPELVWRTVKCHYKLGKVVLEPGDKVVVSIVSATHQSLEEGDYTNVYPIFGGDRYGNVPPTHSCPGKEAAIGVLLGILSAFLEVPETMRPSPAPLAFTLEGLTDHALKITDSPPPSDTQSPSKTDAPTAKSAIPAKASGSESGANANSVGKGHWLLLEGDSWFNYFQKPCISSYLANSYGFSVNNLALATDQLQSIAKTQLDLLCTTFKDMTNRGRPPLAILLSAGGNDVVKERLRPLLRKADNGSPALDEVKVKEVVDGTMKTNLVEIISRIATECKKVGGEPIPIFLHGYDYPVPDNRGAFGVTGDIFSWLYPVFKSLGIESPDIATCAVTMNALIKRLNTMQQGVAQQFQSHVFHVNLTDTLSRELRDDDYKRDWANELHPTDAGFAKITAKFVDNLCQRLPDLRAAETLKAKN